MSVFLSYRRADSSHALWIYPSLIKWFGGESVFWDRKDIAAGEVFADVIERQIGASKAFVALVTDNWLLAKDKDGNRRIDSPEDWIHRETALALQKGLLVIPVLVNMPAPHADDLPLPLRDFSKLQMLVMSDMTFHDLLRERLETVVPAAVPVPSPNAADLQRLQRRAGNLLRRQVQRLQVRAADFISAGLLDRATEELNEGSELLMAILDLLPGDDTLDAQLGYLFSTTAQTFKDAKQNEQAAQYFNLAMSVFERIRRDSGKTGAQVAGAADTLDIASALNGIGTVHYDRGDPVTAIRFKKMALDLYPDYNYAWHDMVGAYDALARRGSINLSAMRHAIDRLRETAAAKPGLGKDKLQDFEVRYNVWVQRGRDYPHLVQSDDKVCLAPTLFLIVITESEPGVVMINLNFDAVHQIASEITVESLSLQVTPPDQQTFQCEWNVFFSFDAPVKPKSLRQRAIMDAGPILLPAGRTGLGVQFVDPTRQVRDAWNPGIYRFQLVGWANAPVESIRFDLKTLFEVQVSQLESSEAAWWMKATTADWNELNDPDRAAGVRAPIIFWDG